MNEKSLIIPFPSIARQNKERAVSVGEMLNSYDIIMNAFMFKYSYEVSKFEKLPVDEKYNLNNVKVFNQFVNLINKKINDTILRQFILNTIANIRNNDFNKKTVRETYKNAYKWFAVESQVGNNFRHLLTVCKEYIYINFEYIFKACNTEAITENSKCFAEVKHKYSELINSLNK